MKLVRTLRHSSSGNVVKGSFFNLGLTNSCTKLSCWLLHMFNSSVSNRSLSSWCISAKVARKSRALRSSCSAAVLQSGARRLEGVGLGAGVGGDAGAEGSMVDKTGRLAVLLRGLEGVCIGRGAGLVL